jgi:hypothetical protein
MFYGNDVLTAHEAGFGCNFVIALARRVIEDVTNTNEGCMVASLSSSL